MAYVSWSVVFGEQPSAAKWNILGTNDASFNDGTGIADGVILPEHLLNGASSLNTWAWDDWTPTLANLSGGTMTYAKYIQIGKTVFFQFIYTLGGAGMGTAPTFTLPVTASSSLTTGAATGANLGTVILQDTGSEQYGGRLFLVSTTICGMESWNAAATTVASQAITSSVPFTWASTDVVNTQGFYEAA